MGEEERWKRRGGWETWWRLLEVEVRAELVSTIRPVAPPPPPPPPRLWQSPASCCPGDPSTVSPVNWLSSLAATPTPTPGPGPKPPPTETPPSSLVLSSVDSGTGLGFRGEARIRAGLETG